MTSSRPSSWTNPPPPPSNSPTSAPEEPPSSTERSRHPKKFECEHKGCNESYLKKEYLHRHQLRHTVKPMYHCDFPGCHHSYARHNFYTRHKERHSANCSQHLKWRKLSKLADKFCDTSSSSPIKSEPANELTQSQLDTSAPKRGSKGGPSRNSHLPDDSVTGQISTTHSSSTSQSSPFRFLSVEIASSKDKFAAWLFDSPSSFH